VAAHHVPLGGVLLSELGQDRLTNAAQGRAQQRHCQHCWQGSIAVVPPGQGSEWALWSVFIRGRAAHNRCACRQWYAYSTRQHHWFGGGHWQGRSNTDGLCSVLNASYAQGVGGPQQHHNHLHLPSLGSTPPPACGWGLTWAVKTRCRQPDLQGPRIRCGAQGPWFARAVSRQSIQDVLWWRVLAQVLWSRTSWCLLASMSCRSAVAGSSWAASHAAACGMGQSCSCGQHLRWWSVAVILVAISCGYDGI
jgi:hypothetical protein